MPKHAEFAMASGEMTREDFTSFLETTFRHLTAHSCDGSIHFICMDWRHMPAIPAAGESAYTELKNLIVWVKDNGGMGTFYRSRHELIFAFKHGTVRAGPARPLSHQRLAVPRGQHPESGPDGRAGAAPHG